MTTDTTTDAGFDADVMKSELPVLLDFWAPWCGPCRQIGPSLEEIAVAYDGRIRVVKINVDENPSTTAKLGVRGIPSLFVINKGQIIANRAGAAPKVEIERWLKSSGVCA